MPDYEDHDTGWRARARFPQRSGPIARTRAEMAGVGALIGAAVFLAVGGVVGGVVGGDWNVFLIFPAFGIPDVLLAWYRWGRWKRGARWSSDLRATMVLTGLTVYLAVRAPIREDPVLLVGVVGGGTAAAIWIVRVIRDRRR